MVESHQFSRRNDPLVDEIKDLIKKAPINNNENRAFKTLDGANPLRIDVD